MACSFCLKPSTEVGTMVAGPGVFICDVCVTLCVDIIANKPDTPPDPAIWDRDLTDAALLELLPKVAAAGAQVERHLTGYVRRGACARMRWTYTWNHVQQVIGWQTAAGFCRLAGPGPAQLPTGE